MGKKIFHCNFSPKEILESHSRLRYLDIDGIDQYLLSNLKIFLKSLNNTQDERIKAAGIEDNVQDSRGKLGCVIISFGSFHCSVLLGFQRFPKNRIIGKYGEKTNCGYLKQNNYKEDFLTMEENVVSHQIFCYGESSRRPDSNNNFRKKEKYCQNRDRYRPLIYHGGISRAMAEAILGQHREGSFLIRDCESSPSCLVLSVRSPPGFLHLKIRRRGGRFVLAGDSAGFEAVSGLVRHYSQHRLRLRGGSAFRLKLPARERIL